MENLKPLLMDLWIGGLGTTSTTLVAACSRLVGHPDVLNRLRQELMTVTYGGSRNLSLQDKPNTPYLNAVLAEVQRLASVVSVNFWRMNNEPIQVGKYHVDAGAVITAQLSAYHGNENVFENPDDFNPDRFYKNEKLMSQLIPFGIGKRSCVGEFIARTELYLVRVFIVASIHSWKLRCLATSSSATTSSPTVLFQRTSTPIHSALPKYPILLFSWNSWRLND